jgi:hypothetical protein
MRYLSFAGANLGFLRFALEKIGERKPADPFARCAELGEVAIPTGPLAQSFRLGHGTGFQ